MNMCRGKRHIYGPGGGYCACRQTYWGPRIRQATTDEIAALLQKLK